ncbi:sorbosone dehydrogenase family protein [Maribrevibacterium harenarium]|uniref:Sorbosone dehydrogenase family protein n=1 Tax=Maribrevibacterium harenarium TaxID=2589817 RepID=A0A501WH11_9GAMM|nr:sorbosone dehydrogenase family protein [Maribrevibacterium harenarium]TPE47344.1 sorbosone dehydrogenase family protein [Maribrevibacterium harenarium]
MHWRKQLSKIAVGLLASHSLIAQALEQQPILQSKAQDWRIEVIAEGLDYPWDLVAVDKQQLLVTQKSGEVLWYSEGRLQRQTFQPSTPLRTHSGAGLHGVALVPDFSSSKHAYFYYSYSDNGLPLNRVVMAQLVGSSWQETQIIIDAIPGHDYYNGGRIAFGPDGYLYVTTGWTENYQRPQDTSNLAGKILRVASDGSIPADNPYPDSPVYSIGHRNPQGLAWSPDGELFVAEHGQAALDELNRVRAGGNYGWPVISGDESQAGMESPFVHSGRTTWAPSGIAFVGSELVMATLKGNGLYVLDESNKTLQPLPSTGERYRQILPSSDGFYVITTNRSPRGSGPSKDTLLRYRRQ